MPDWGISRRVQTHRELDTLAPVTPVHEPLALSIVASTEVGAHGVMHLPRYWSRTLASVRGATALPHEPDLDAALLNLLRLGIEPTTRFLITTRPSLEEFERYVDGTSGGLPSADAIARFNDAVVHGDRPVAHVPSDADVLTDEHWHTWREHGYVVVDEALSCQACERSVQLVCEHLGVDEHDPSTWYERHPSKQGIMVQLFQHAQLEENRLAPRVRRVFEELWARTASSTARRRSVPMPRPSQPGRRASSWRR